MFYTNITNNTISSGFSHRLIKNKSYENSLQNKLALEAYMVLENSKKTKTLDQYKNSSKELKYLIGYSRFNPFISKNKKYNLITTRLAISFVELVEQKPMSEQAKFEVTEFKKY